MIWINKIQEFKRSENILVSNTIQITTLFTGIVGKIY